MSTDDSICESSLNPNKSSGDIGERLRKFASARWAIQYEHDEWLEDAAAEIERLRREVRDANRHWNERCVELSVNAHGWMKAHDQLLGFIQSRPELLKVMMTEKPEIKYPSPADVPELVQRALSAESAVAAAWEEAAKIAEQVGNFGDYKREELTPDFGQPRFDMMTAIASAIRAAVSKKTAESGHSPSTHNSESE